MTKLDYKIDLNNSAGKCEHNIKAVKSVMERS